MCFPLTWSKINVELNTFPQKETNYFLISLTIELLILATETRTQEMNLSVREEWENK